MDPAAELVGYVNGREVSAPDAGFWPGGGFARLRRHARQACGVLSTLPWSFGPHFLVLLFSLLARRPG
ncbi:Hypothetical predicted protein [Lynx pardinus]|uniref:Uncharacterized protein n=1 Tax=Lynx pardinus TaxID=191816 RepID=A0A485PEG5_LYNPA|nr:Hypothetical predicted protein [Lynx pardinus]